MTDRRLRMLEDKHLRDSARALVEADVEHIKADFANKGMAKRALFRLRENAGELYDEALDVADRIAVLNKGRIEQVGSPTDVYDAPANSFVMSFLGTVSLLNGIPVRPHDIRVGRSPDMAVAAGDGTAESTGVTKATVERIVTLGFEVRVELISAVNQTPFTAQITRGDAEALGLRAGDTVYVRATRVPAIAGEPPVAADVLS